jgi:methyl-accepting chemotaxis protein
VRFSNIKIGNRLTAGFAVVLALMVGLTAIGIKEMTQIQNKLDHIVHSNVYKIELLHEMANSIHVVARVTRSMAMITDEAKREREYPKIVDAYTRYDKAFAALEATPASGVGQMLRDKIREHQKLVQPLNSKALVMARTYKPAEAIEFLLSQAGPATQKWQDALQEDISFLKESNEKDVTDAREAFNLGRSLMIALSLSAFTLGALIAWLITRSITGPIYEAVQVAKTVAAGDLSSCIIVDSKDETGQLLLALKDMNGSLQNIVGQVRTGAGTIATSSGQITSGNLDLSARTEQQASSLEETASSMEELTSTVKQNGENARQANQLAMSASEIAIKGGVVVAQVVGTMNQINESARKIVDIISVIDGIAFQTNILALNAAVEAARAGEQGRGFAVVASEVRSLAQRSASAAKEIKQLIGDSVEKVDAGSKLVNQAGATMDEIVDSVKRVTDIMSEISAAGREQEAGIKQINTAISEMDTVTQQNAALVEEAAAAAESLQDQAANLAKVVSVFKLDSGPQALNGISTFTSSSIRITTKSNV